VLRAGKSFFTKNRMFRDKEPVTAGLFQVLSIRLLATKTGEKCGLEVAEFVLVITVLVHLLFPFIILAL